MAKTQKKKSPAPVGWTPKLTNWAKQHQFRVLLIVVVVALVGWVAAAAVSNHIKTAHEREQFAQAKTDLDEIYSNIVASVGPPTQHKAVQSCSYTSTDFGTGARSCSIDQYIFYAAPNESTAMDKAYHVNNAISADKNVRRSTLAIRNFGGKHLSLDFDLAVFKGCNTESRYLRDEPTNFPGLLFVQGGGLSMDINCSGAARAEYYPLSTTITGAPIY